MILFNHYLDLMVFSNIIYLIYLDFHPPAPKVLPCAEKGVPKDFRRIVAYEADIMPNRVPKAGEEAEIILTINACIIFAEVTCLHYLVQ